MIYFAQFRMRVIVGYTPAKNDFLFEKVSLPQKSGYYVYVYGEHLKMLISLIPLTLQRLQIYIFGQCLSELNQVLC